MSQFELVVVLLVAAIPLVTLARRAAVGYPVLLVLGGLAIGFVPGMPTVEIPPELILVIFLPPLLFWQAVSSPFRAFRVFATPIVRLAIGLVAITAVLVAVVAHALVPGLPWAAAFVLGAVVGPTDEVAFVPIAERLDLPTRIVAIVQGESLLNDAVALVVFAVATDATVTGRFSWIDAGLRFAWTTAGSLGIGVVVGIAVVTVASRLRDPMLAALLALLSGYLAYIPAQHLGLSGVLATLVAGLIVARYVSADVPPRSRVLNRDAWDVLLFVLNTVIFILVGVQLRPIAAALHGIGWPSLALDALAVNGVVFGARAVWTMGVAYPIDRYVRTFEDVPPWRNYVVTAWAGMRGGVSLAAALAIPLRGAHGEPFPHRALLIFLTFTVILFTLVVQGGTLAAVIRMLGVGDDGAERREEDDALVTATRVSLERLDALVSRGEVPADAARAMRERYEKHVLDGDASAEVRALYRAETTLLTLQHEALVTMRNRGDIENTTLRRLETQLDFKRMQLAEEIDRRSDGTEPAQAQRAPGNLRAP